MTSLRAKPNSYKRKPAEQNFPSAFITTLFLFPMHLRVLVTDWDITMLSTTQK